MLSWWCGMVESFVIGFTFPVSHHELRVPTVAMPHPNLVEYRFRNSATCLQLLIEMPSWLSYVLVI
jgi:hypothetical protein